jgi:kynurenine formamidase
LLLRVLLVEYVSIENGDSANTKLLEFCNHSGTHIDFPNHFSIHGKVVEDYDANFWIFNLPHFIEIEAIDNQIIIQTNVLQLLQF